MPRPLLAGTLALSLACAAHAPAAPQEPVMPSASGLRPVRFADVPSRVAQDFERAKAMVRPPEITFALDGGPVIDGRSVVLHGHVDNPTDRDVTVIVFPVVNWANPFYLRLVPDAHVTRRPPDPNMPPPPPPAPPPPLELDLPARSRVALEASDDLALYRWEGTPTVQLDWSFQFWQPPKPGGRLGVQLPEPKR